MPSSTLSSLVLRLSTFLILLLQPTAVLSQCKISHSHSCNKVGDLSISQTITIEAGVESSEEYEAEVKFHWGAKDDTNFGTNTYATGEEQEIRSSEYYDEAGTYYIGYTVVFGEGSGCEGKSFERYKLVTYTGARGQTSCSFDESFEGTNVPTRMISDAPASASPTESSKIVTSSPSPKKSTPIPIELPIITPPPTWAVVETLSPTNRPTTLKPTPSPAKGPETLLPVTPDPTPNPTPPSTEIGGSPDKTLSPTTTAIRPTTPLPTTASPTIAVTPGETSSPSPKPTRQPIVTVYNETVSSVMFLYHSDKLDPKAEEIWTDVTQETIVDEVAYISGIDQNKIFVNVVLTHQNPIPARRMLQQSSSSSTPGMELGFTTKIIFPSETTYVYNADQLVSSGFDTAEDQMLYISELKKEGAPEYFTEVERMGLLVNNKPVLPPSAGTEGGNDAGGNSSVVPIVAGVVVGVLAIVFIVIGVYYTRRNKNNISEAKQSHKTQDSPEQVSLETSKQNELSAGDTAVNLPEGESYFGTIEATRDAEGGFDDVSTLGDPYMGDAVNAVIDSDNTVGESTVRSQQQEYGVGRGLDAGTIMSSRFGGSTIGSNRMVFTDDPTLEDIYQTPDGNPTEQDISFQRIKIAAPSGMLGIVLDNPHLDLPVVYAIKETSALHGKIRVGDLLLSVDEVDCRGMSAHQISAFLSSRSQNPVRTLVLARGTPGGNTAV